MHHTFAKLSLAISLSASIALAHTATAAPAINDQPLKIKTHGGLSVATVDDAYSVQLGGRLQWDYNRSELDGAVDENDLNIRRARIFVQGKVTDDWSYKLEFNVDENEGGTPEDLFITYNGWGKAARLAIGKQRVLFGLEDFISSNDNSALERAAITERYSIGRQDSVRLFGEFNKLYYSVSVYEEAGAADDNDFSVSARTAYTPVVSGDMLVHLGFAVKDTAAESQGVGVEFAVNLSSFHFQSEYFEEEQSDVVSSGFYLQAGYILTGEVRPYKGGKFGRVKPNSGSAWEIFTRYEQGDGDYGDIELGRVDATAYTIGVNWYAHENVRLGVNYSAGESEALASNEDGEEFRARVQLTF